MKSSNTVLKKPLTLCLTILCTSMSLSAAASFKHFEAPMEESTWQFEGNPISCRLTHRIPLYGKASFSQIAGKDEALKFNLGYKRHRLAKDSMATVRALAPSWQPKVESRELGQVKLIPGNIVLSSEATASWRLLNELEIGRFPTFFYQDFNQTEDQVAVSLSSVGFRSAYGNFLDCLTGLVDYKLNELSKMTLYFDFDRDSVKGKYQEKLAALSQYIKYDDSVEIVFLNGYTDSKGSRGYNQKLAERRVDSVKKILQQQGVDDSRFKLSAFGEKHPAASNRTPQGRALNRRVYIRIAQK